MISGRSSATRRPHSVDCTPLWCLVAESRRGSPYDDAGRNGWRNGSILPSGPLARLNACNHRGPPSPRAHHAGLHHRVLQPECFHQVRLCLLPLWRRLRRHSAVSRIGRGGVLAARLTRFWRGRSGADDTASAFARRQHRSLRLVTVGFKHALDQLQVEAAHQLGILARELMEWAVTQFDVAIGSLGGLIPAPAQRIDDAGARNAVLPSLTATAATVEPTVPESSEATASTSSLASKP